MSFPIIAVASARRMDATTWLKPRSASVKRCACTAPSVASLKLAAEPCERANATTAIFAGSAAMLALLDSLRYDPSFGTAAALNKDLNAESKSGIPRFRVRTRIQRENLTDKDETKKYGPPGLRLIEGLRGSALRMAQSMEQSVLASEKGTEELLRTFENALKPRREQEARELCTQLDAEMEAC